MNSRTPAAVALATAALLLTGAAAVTAQDAPPSVTVKIEPTAMRLAGHDGLAGGPTRFVVRATGKRQRGFELMQLNEGVTPEEVAERIRTMRDASKVERELGRFVAGSIVSPGTKYATTVDLESGQYALIDITRTPRLRTSFTVGDARNTAQMPDASASIVAEDYRFRLPATLPSRGPYRVENRGDRIHHVLALRLRRHASSKRVVRQMLKGKQPKGVVGSGSAVTELVSGGTTNVVEGRFRKGRILLVCFLRDTPKSRPHAALGMYKAVRVR